MTLLKDILYGVGLSAVQGDTHVAINQVHFDSRQVGIDDVFVAVNGLTVNGHHFVQQAVNAGAKAVICEKFPELIVNGVTYLRVDDSATALSVVAANCFDNPSKNLKLIGVTGTNGKTTVATLLYRLFKKSGYKVGLISTIAIFVDDEEYPATHTTPDALTINSSLRQMSDTGVEFCFMEVSSHGIDQKRTKGLHFSGAVFTNLSHDHLDYHKTFANYRDTKKILFDELPKTAFALTNLDDKNGMVLLQNTPAKKYTYALKSYADFRTQILERQLDGQLVKIDDSETWIKPIGDFNAYNMLAIYAVAMILGLEKIKTLQILSQLENVAGRFQYHRSKSKITAIVDYAHTPDALKNVLTTINALRTGNENVITVVGCGGDRDRSKRPVMGHIAALMSDQAIFTSDNPRSEPPKQILLEMEKGVEPQHAHRVLVIEDRRQAIRTACKLAVANDIILIAGKGHEAYQEIKGKRTDFDDYKEVKEALVAT